MGDPPCGIGGPRIAEPLANQLEILARRRSGRRSDMRYDFLSGDLPQKSVNGRMGHGLGYGFASQQFAGRRDDLMASVQNAQFHCFEPANLVRKSDADRIQSRTAGAKIVFDHPLAEILMGHRHGVRDAESARKRDFPGNRRGINAITALRDSERNDPDGRIRTGQ